MASSPKDELIEKVVELEAVKAELERRKYLNDLYLFNQEVLQIGKGKSDKPLGEFHKQLCEFVEKTTDGTDKKLVLVPRGHLKSTMVTLGYALQQIAKNPDIRILIANATYEMASSFLGAIKKHLRDNPHFKRLYGDLATGAEKWSENMITVGSKKFGKKEATVTTFGLGGNLVSQHYDIIIMDDIVNRDFINTPEQIQRTILFYKDALDLLEPGGEMIIIGTRWSDADLYGWIQDETNVEQVYKNFSVFLRRSYEGNLESGENLEILWPAKFTREILQTLRVEKGIVEFAAQYQNDPMPQETAEFKKEWIKTVLEDELRSREIQYFTMCDPAISQKKSGDKTAIVTIGVDQWNNWFLVNIIWGQFRPDELFNHIFTNWEQYHPLKIGIEMAAFAQSLKYPLVDEMRRRNMFLPIVELKAEKSKEERIRGLIPRYSNGTIYHLQQCPYRSDMENELLRFPRGRHDDIIDALAYGGQIAFPARKPHIKRPHHGRYLY